MIRVKPNTHCLFSSYNIQKLLIPQKTHTFLFLCWLSLILTGTFLIGLSTSLFTKQFTYCQQNEPFCSRQLTLSSRKQMVIYVVVQNIHQNNRMFLDSYSERQFQGNVHNSYHCEGYDTYQKLGKNSNAGGYRVSTKSSAFPCGKVMTNIFNDAIYLITSSGGIPTLDSFNLISQYNLNHKFINLDNYQLRQWTDIESSSFVNYFTIPFTSTKYFLVGRLELQPDSYQLIVKNNFETSGSQMRKKLVVSEVNQLGIRDPILGFYMFVWGILVLFFHLIQCCRGVKSSL